MRAQLVLRIVRGHHHKLAPFRNAGQVLPCGKGHQSVPRAERHLPHIRGLMFGGFYKTQGLAAPVNGQQTQPICFAHRDVSRGLPDQV